MGILEDINKGPLESLIDDKVKEARGRDLLRGAFIQGQAPVDTSLLKKEDFVDPVMALPRDLAKKGGVGNLLKSVAAGSLGLLGDLGSIFPGAQNSIAGQAPTTDELGEKFGADFSRPGGMLGMVGAPDPSDIARLGGKGLLAMTLFHGTPHRFDKFALDKIGTGEGAQAFGHGLYFAENPGVARSYQNTITRFQPDQVKRQLTESGISDDVAQNFADLYVNQGAGVNFRGNTVFDEFEEIVNKPGPAHQIEEFRARARAELPALKEASESIKDAGHLYEVELDDKVVDRMLDWDAPLSEQPESVQGVIVRLLGGDDPMWITHQGERVPLSEVSESTARKIGGQFGTQSELLLKSDAPAEQIYKELANRLGGDEAVSQALKEAGIPGIRYKSGQLSGGAGDTSNIVVFDPDDITQVKRDGELVFENKSGLKPAREYYEGDTREIAHQLKSGNPQAISFVADEMASRVPRGATFIPVPGHGGDAKETLALAEAIAARTDGNVSNVLRSNETAGQYATKSIGGLLSDADIGTYALSDIPSGDVFLVDNVMATGNTMKAAQNAVPNAKPLVFAVDSKAK